MPDPRNRLTWKATCKVYPAISDLAAIESVITYVLEGIAVDAAHVLYGNTVPAGKIWVITNVVSYCANGTARNRNINIYEVATVKAVLAYADAIVGTIPLNFFGHAYLDEGERIGWSYSATATGAIPIVSYNGYQIAKY